MQIKADTKKLTRYLNSVQRKQIPFATSKALNDVAFDARKAIQEDLPKQLDRPTKGLVRSVIVVKSTKKNLVAMVGFAGRGFGKTKWSESPAEIMGRLITGGARKPTGKAILVPVAKNVKLNKFGNLPRTKIKTMLSKSKRYFSGTPKGRGPGVYERVKKRGKQGQLKMIASWKQSTSYNAGSFNLVRVVQKTVAKKYKTRFNEALANALRTAK